MLRSGSVTRRIWSGANHTSKAAALRRKWRDVFLLDDGFQHLKLARDVDIVLCEWERKIPATGMLPREVAGTDFGDR